MKVIVAGFSKTGTKTLNSALTKLGYTVYDYPENAFILGDDWEKIQKYGWTTADFKRMYENVDVVMDAPCCCFWEEIHKAFPDAKIILSIRDSDEQWLKSLEKQMLSSEGNWAVKLMTYLSPTYRSIMNKTALPTSLIMYGVDDIRAICYKPYNRDLFKLKYRAHNAYVLQNAPSDKLLVYKVTEGWDPLCKFLGIPVPDEPFPHKNKGGDIIQEMLATHPTVIRMKREMILSTVTLATMLCVGGYFVYKRGWKDLSITSMIDSVRGLTYSK